MVFRDRLLPAPVLAAALETAKAVASVKAKDPASALVKAAAPEVAYSTLVEALRLRRFCSVSSHSTPKKPARPAIRERLCWKPSFGATGPSIYNASYAA